MPTGQYRLAINRVKAARELGQKKLDLKFLGLTRLPPSLFELKELAELELHGNNLASLPDEIGQLSSLVSLELEANGLASLPPAIGRLSRLRRLFLRDNRLSALPPEITNLPLEAIFIYGNEVTALPAAMLGMKNLRVLDLRNNFLTIPPEILDKRDNPTGILNYYYDIRRTPSTEMVPLREAKLIVVGQASVGKTSLVNRLLHDKYDPNESRTPGIDINRWQPSGQPYALNVWDFGGQEIMHATHQFFLTRRAVYLLVIDVRQDEVDNRLDYWMKTVETFAGKSPVILVGNKSDEQPLDINETGIRSRYPTVAAILDTSCLSGHGIDALKERIFETVANLPYIEVPIPRAWYTVKQSLQNITKNYIPYERYVEVCNELSIDAAAQETLITFLHDLGIVLKYDDSRFPVLSETYILDPEWVTQGVYKILNDRELLQEGGMLDWTDLRKVLEPPAYADDTQRRFIINMMEKFELCYSVGPSRESAILVPDLLRKDEPYTGDWTDALSFEYQYDLLPPSLFARFIVRNHRMVHMKTLWRNGVVLHRGDNIAMISVDRIDRIIRIHVKGPVELQRAFLGVLRDQFRALHETYIGLPVQEIVPVPKQPGVTCNLETLRSHELLGLDTILPDKSLMPISVAATLEVYEPAAERTYRRRLKPDGPPDKLMTHAGSLVFVSCHDEDIEKGREIYSFLEQAGYNPWMPERDLSGGQDRLPTINLAIERSAIFIKCISKASLGARGELQRELKLALERFMEMLPGDIYLVPVLLDPGAREEQLDEIQAVKFYEGGWDKKLSKAIERAMEQRAA